MYWKEHEDKSVSFNIRMKTAMGGPVRMNSYKWNIQFFYFVSAKINFVVHLIIVKSKLFAIRDKFLLWDFSVLWKYRQYIFEIMCNKCYIETMY